MNKLVSVIMSVYNTNERFLRGAIESILLQTYRSFEFLIVLDCPTDNSAEIVREYERNDKRITVIVNEHNLGLTKSLNIALGQAKGEYIARMDADDYSVPDRLEIEVKYLDNYPEVGVVGGLVYTGIKRSRFMTAWNKDQITTRIHMLFHNAGVAHPTAMFRKELSDGTKPLYDETIKKSQDFALWADLIWKTKVVVLDEMLLVYRVHSNQITANSADQMKYAGMVVEKQFREKFGISDSPTLELFKNIYLGNENIKIDEIREAFDRLVETNDQRKLFPKRKFKAIQNEILLECWYINKRSKSESDKIAAKSFFQMITPLNISRFFSIYILPKYRCDLKFKKFKNENAEFLRNTVKLDFESM